MNRLIFSFKRLAIESIHTIGTSAKPQFTCFAFVNNSSEITIETIFLGEIFQGMPIISPHT